MQTAGKGGYEGEFGEGLPGLRGTAGNSHLVQVSGTGADGRGRKLLDGGRQPEEGKEQLDTDDEDTGQGGGRPDYLGVVLKEGHPGGVAFRVRGVVPDSPYGAGPKQLPAQGSAPDHWEASGVAGGREMGVSSAGGSNGGIGF